MSTANKLKRVIHGSGAERIPAVVASDRPSGPEPEIPAAEATAEPVIQAPATVEPVPFEFTTNLAQPTAADPDALKLLAEVRGAVAVAEAIEAVAVLDGHAKALRDRLTGDEPPAGLIAQLRDLAVRRGVYAARAQALGAILAQPVEIPAGAPEVPALALRLRELPAGKEIVGYLSHLIALAQSELTGVAAQIDGASAIAESEHFRHKGLESGMSHDGRRIWLRTAAAPDAWLAEASELTGHRREILERLERLCADRDQAVNLVAEHVSQAVVAAGGRDFCVGRLATAMALSGAAPTDPPGLAEANELVARLTEGGADQSDIDQAKANRQAILDTAVTDRAERVARRREMASRMLDLALAGDESGRQAVEGILSKAPAVAPGLLDEIRQARADRRVLALI